MIEVTDTAKAQLDEYFNDKEKSAIRVYVASGCGGQRLALALDEPRESDTTHQSGGYDFLVEPAIQAEASYVKIDFSGHGFSLASDLPLQEGGAGGCGSGCGSCGCGH